MTNPKIIEAIRSNPETRKERTRLYRAAYRPSTWGLDTMSDLVRLDCGLLGIVPEPATVKVLATMRMVEGRVS